MPTPAASPGGHTCSVVWRPQRRLCDTSSVIDIFIPYWGDPKKLYDAVDSVLAQTSSGWRLTVVDDCYPEDVTEHFQTIKDPRVRYIRNDKNLGIIDNFTKCQQMAEGDYTVIMGCDDLLHPEYVATIERAAKHFPSVEIIQPGVKVVDDSGSRVTPLADRVKSAITPRGKGTRAISGENLATSLFVGDWLYWPSLAFRTDALKKVKFDPDYQIILDLGLVMDLVQSGARLALTNDIVFFYRRHADSLSSRALLDGPRFKDEKKFFAERAEAMEALGWRKAARAARLHLTSRLHALAMLPGAVVKRKGVSELLRLAFSRTRRPQEALSP